MTTESIDKVRQQAKELGIYEIIKNICKTSKPNQTVEWESCTLKYQADEKTKIVKPKSTSFIFTHAIFDESTTIPVTSITMPDGTILYRSEGSAADTQQITDFRFGKWVERITAYSNELTVEREQKKQDKLAKEKEELLKPFSEIDF